VLLYAQPIARIVQLTMQDIVLDDVGLWLRLGDPPSPVPEPFADLLLRLLDQRPSMAMATNQNSQWLLPGRRAGQPMEANTIRKRLALAGIPNLHARTAALRQLVLQAPAPVVAGMLGIHPVHAAFVTRQAGADWSRYAAGEHTRASGRQSPRI
jgi:integrase